MTGVFGAMVACGLLDEVVSSWVGEQLIVLEPPLLEVYSCFFLARVGG